MTSEALAAERIVAPLPTIEPATRAESDPARAGLQRAVALAALATLAVANAVGLWLAMLLLWPELGRFTGALTYGRWMPLHLDLQLYGWCSLPVIGLLLARFLPRTTGLRFARLALAAWCGALAAGSLAWLGGHTSGKIFLDWSGAAGIAFALAQLFLWSVLAAGWWAHGRRTLDGALLPGLLAVPVALYLSARPDVYPPINPHSGGATGHSLLASSLAVVGIALALPVLLGRPARRPVRGAAIPVVSLFAASWGVYAVIPHGNASHRELAQIAGLATLLPWPLWIGWWLRIFCWEETQRRWLVATAVWGSLLVADGFLLFLPGVLERAKFTHALVAHAHLAMAGLFTSLNVLMLVSLAPRTRLAAALAARGPWLAWNAAGLVMVAVLTLLGWSEGADPRFLVSGAPIVTAGYGLRLLCGVVMFGAGAFWLHGAWRTRAENLFPHAG